MTISHRKGASARRKGSKNERKFAGRLNVYLKGSGLQAKRVPGSGAWGAFNEALAGDVTVARPDGTEVERLEVKVRDPNKRRITIATMDGRNWRANRRILACRHDRGPWIVSMWAPVWDELHRAMSGAAALYSYQDRPVRGVNLNQIQEEIGKCACNAAVFWGAAIYMEIRTFADILKDVYAEAKQPGERVEGTKCRP